MTVAAQRIAEATAAAQRHSAATATTGARIHEVSASGIRYVGWGHAGPAQFSHVLQRDASPQRDASLKGN